jgi:hypothetical protein
LASVSATATIAAATRVASAPVTASSVAGMTRIFAAGFAQAGRVRLPVCEYGYRAKSFDEMSLPTLRRAAM